ncbi:iron-containing alcohol dehydrogenase family protein [Oceanobacillus piezotolerans]|uniref:Iron-containing alcohol dehydrogenase family protein n=1 Tax=Oceanobacillus piezotolerans TaxID=2448030 RepID=A0A498DC09_9BACI|nr:iron-containing alcohol dehydrogenase family protein [Oceanobacillus piezotolerans]RLL43651.1 iron-containing alcohol dehydrogenase family protein [Oceanobacillus piezotolerans]
MRLSQVVRSGPSQFISEAGALKYLDNKLEVFKNPVVITGEKSFESFLKHYKGDFHLPVYQYDGTASHEDMERLAKAVKGSDCIVGIGGGRVLDTAKGTADLLNVDYVMIPTVLGTCAAYTPLSAVYHPDHSFKMVDYYEKAAFLCLVDLELLVESPKEFFMGGIGDTLAKWYEAEAITRHVTTELPAMVHVGLKTAKLTQEILLQDTKAALTSLEEQKVTPAFGRVTEAVIAVAGTVGGFAGEYGRMAGAHAVHNGMSLVPETHAFAHGVKVAYGVLVQLMATGDADEVEKLVPFFRENRFPHQLSEFGVKEEFEAKAEKIAAFAASDAETFNLAVREVTTEDVLQAMKKVEAYGKVEV